jgi:hypothetical protein
MGYLISHYYEGGTEAQYRTVLAEVHPGDGLPPGQLYHAAGPTQDGWLIMAVWDSEESCAAFVRDTLMPGIGRVNGGFVGPPQERAAQIVTEVKA